MPFSVCVCVFLVQKNSFMFSTSHDTKSNMKLHLGQVLLFVALIQEKKYCTSIWRQEDPKEIK